MPSAPGSYQIGMSLGHIICIRRTLTSQSCYYCSLDIESLSMTKKQTNKLQACLYCLISRESYRTNLWKLQNLKSLLMIEIIVTLSKYQRLRVLEMFWRRLKGNIACVIHMQFASWRFRGCFWVRWLYPWVISNKMTPHKKNEIILSCQRTLIGDQNTHEL